MDNNEQRDHAEETYWRNYCPECDGPCVSNTGHCADCGGPLAQAFPTTRNYDRCTRCGHVFTRTTR